MTRQARLVIRAAAWLVPAGPRARWREEWLAEYAAIAGHDRAKARRFARGAFRDAWAVRQSARLAARAIGRSRTSWRAGLGGDLRQTARRLADRPVHSAAVIVCLGVGLVASIGMFSVLTSLLYGDQPGIVDRASLARVFMSYDTATGVETIGGGRRVIAVPLSLSDFEALRDRPRNSSLESLAVEGKLRIAVSVGGRPESVDSAFASGSFFGALRTPAIVGRPLAQADDEPGAPAVAVVTEHFWRTRLGGAASAVGQAIYAGGSPYTVVGVMIPRFHGMSPLEPGQDDSHGTQVWLPLAHAGRFAARPADDEPWLTAVGRMRPGATKADVERELSAASVRVARERPHERTNAAVVVRSHGFGPGEAPLAVMLVLWMVMLLPVTILAIGAANVANLQLASAADRARELSVRLSLGATRWQLVRLLTLETLGRTAIAVTLALALLAAAFPRMGAWLPMQVTFDVRVAAFAVALTLAVVLATGLVPAWLVLRRPAVEYLKQGVQGGGLGHRRMRAALVAVQVALSLVLLVVTGLLVRTVSGMERSAPPSLSTQLVVSFDPTEIGVTPREARAFADGLVDRATLDSRVTHVSISQVSSVRVGGAGSAPDQDRVASLVAATPTWFDMMEVKHLAGRALTAVDRSEAVLVSEHLAELVAPGRSPLGLSLRIEDGSENRRTVEIVGVVADLALRPTVERPGPVVYSSLPAGLTSPFSVRLRFDSAESATAAAPDLQRLVAAENPDVAWTAIERGDVRYLQDAREMRLIGVAVGACGLVALLLSATGLYAVISYLVSLRRREIGIRLAIGGHPGRMTALVVRQAAGLALAGAALGLVLAVPIALVMRATFVVPVDALDPWAFAPTLLILAIVTLLSAAVPARRAASVDPVTVLRGDN